MCLPIFIIFCLNIFLFSHLTMIEHLNFSSDIVLKITCCPSIYDYEAESQKMINYRSLA